MRLYYIMNDFIAANDFLSLEYFMKKYEVSRRTIQNDLAYLMQVSLRKGYQLQMRRGSGYLLEVTNQELLYDFVETLSANSVFDMKDRVKNIIAFLVLQHDYISMTKIAEVFQISKTSIKKDMNEVEEMAINYQLELEKKSHYGVLLKGDDKYYKMLIGELYFDENTFVLDAIHSVVHDFSKVEAELIKLFEKEELNINYNELKNVIVWLKVSVYYAHCTHEQHADIKLEAHFEPVKRIAYELTQILENHYSIGIGQKSYEQLEEILNKNVRAKTPVISFTNRLQLDLDEFLEETDQTYLTEFNKDKDFKDLLLTHISLLIDRLHQKISYKNTLIDEICIRYPMIFNIAIRLGDVLKEKYKVELTRDEVGFVATHLAAHMEKERKYKLQRFNKIGVVCSSGGGSAYLIKLQIESLFTQAEVETYSFLELDNLERFEPDLIFTIMPLNRQVQAPIIYIKELLDDTDLMRIRQILQYEQCDSISITNTDFYFYSFFSRDFFQIQKDTNYQEVIKRMATQLEESGYGGDNYCEYVLEREEYMSTIYMNGVGIPHPIQMSARKNMISVCILENPIMEQDKEVQLIFMISLTKEDYEIHKDITKKLYQLMRDKKRLERVLTSRSFEELLIVMKELDGGSI